jgi:RNA polymerase sigma factor (sigma-70 family)
MIATDDDAALLISFARHGDEAAFRTLAERHLGLVFHTALRRTGNRPMAEEVTQNVLCAVAGKAGSLARHPERFQPWLHRAALFESTKAMRKEASHQRRKQLLHPDEMPETTHAEKEVAWQAALPHLDVALDQLPEGDRRVVLLHFFERLTFPRIAALMGKSPDAVQKQSVRALEKLSRVLRSRGMAVPVGMLAAGIATESAKAAPVGLLAGLTGKALATAAAGGTAGHGVSMTLATHSKLWVAAAVVVVALPLGFQQMAIAQAEAELASLKSGSLAAAGPGPSPVGERRIPDVSTGLDLVKLAEEAERASRVQPVKLALDRKLAALEPQVLDSLLAGAKTVAVGATKRKLLAGVLISALAKKHLPRVVERVSRDWMFLAEPSSGRSWIEPLFEQWTKSDLTAARAWLEGVQQRPEYVAARAKELAINGGGADDKLNYLHLLGNGPLLGLQAAVTKQLLASDVEEARRYLASFPPETWQTAILENVLISLMNVGKADPLIAPTNVGQAGRDLAVIRDLPEVSRGEVLDRLVTVIGTATLLGKAEPLLEAPGTTSEEKRRIASVAVKTFISNIQTPADPGRREAAQVWLEGVLPEQSGEVMDAVMQAVDAEWARMGVSQLADLKKILESGAPRSPDWRYGPLSVYVFKGDLLRQALEMAQEIPDPKQRESTIEALRKNSQR